MSTASDAKEETKRFGELAVENGYASPSEIEVALEAQKQTDTDDVSQAARLGQILLDMGTLTPEQVEAVLLAQARLKRRASGPVLDTETDTKIFVPRDFTLSAASLAAEPSGWLILETEGRSSNAFPLREKSLLGRAPTHEVPVPDMLASREHACVEFVDGRHVLTDLASRNGTFVNEVLAEQPVPLKAGDRIRIGQIILRYAPGTKAKVARPAADPEPAPEIEAMAQAETVSVPKDDPTPPAAAEEKKVEQAVPAHDESSTTLTAISDAKPPEEESPEPGEPAKSRPQLDEAKKAAKVAGRGAAAACRKFDELVAKIPPRKFHNQRKYVAAGAAFGMLAIFLPWIVTTAGSHLGLFTWTGWLSFALFGATMALVLLKAGPKPVEFKLFLAVVSLPALAALFVLLMRIKDGQFAEIGIYATILIGITTSLLAFLTRGAFEPAPEDAPLVAPSPATEEPREGGFKGFAGRFMEKTRRLARDVSGKRAKEKAAAAARRDELLLEIADAAVQEQVDLPEIAAVLKADEGLAAARQKGESAGAKGAVQHKQQLKMAESKLQRARLKLARTLVDQGPAVEGIQPKIDEVKSLDATVKDLS